jgi:phage-related minor tail protein
MAGAIKGITIEIGGDTTKLGKALSDVNKKSKDLQKELNGVNSLLKMDPGNVTLLTQKQDLLTKSIANTKEKLETLQEAQKQVQEQFEKGEITEEQYRDLQREIVATEQKLEKLTDEVKEFGSVGAQQIAQVGEKVQGVGEKVTQFGQGFSVVSAGTGAVLAGSIAAFKELDSGYDTIITKTGATGDALDELNAVADNIFGSMPTDMDTVSIAVGEINTRFGYTGEKLETLSTQFIQFAEINGVDLNNSIGTVDKILEQFNLTGEDAAGVLDLITLKAQQTGIGADTLLKSIQDNGATFKDMGIGVNEAVVLLSQFEANGVNVETALKGLKKATSEYAEEGLSMEEGLAKTIDGIKNAKTETEALALAQEVFGTKGANEMAKAIREGRINVDDLSASMEDYAGVVKDTYEGTLDPIDQSTVAMNNLKLAGSELGGALQTTFAPILTKLVEKLKTLVSRFSNLSPSMQSTIVIILAIVTAIGPLILIIGQLITSIGSIMTFAPQLVTAFNAVKTAFTTLGAAFTANPIGIVVAAIAALVAAFVLLWNNCEGFRNFWIGLWENIKLAFQAFVDWISPAIEVIKGFFLSLWTKIQEIWNGIITSLQPLIEAIKGAFQSAWELIKTIWDAVAPYFSAIWDGIKAVFSVVKDVLGLAFQNAWEAIKLAWSVAVDYFKMIWENIKLVFSVVKTYFEGMFKTAWEAIKAIWDAVVGYFTTIWESIKGIFSVVKNVLTGNWRDAWEGIKGIVSTWTSYFSGVWNSIKNVFCSVKTWFSSTFSAAWTAVQGVFSNWGSFFSGLWDKIKNTFSKIGTNISNAISSSLKSGVNGIISSIENVINGGIDLINGAINLINEIPGVNISKIQGLSLPRLARGGIVNRPTFAEIGEDGAEAIIPLEKNTEWLDKVAQRLDRNNPIANNAEVLTALDRIYDRLNRLQVVLNNGVLVGEILDDIDAGLADKQLLNARGV